jgi:hypothetical protein
MTKEQNSSQDTLLMRFSTDCNHRAAASEKCIEAILIPITRFYAIELKVVFAANKGKLTLGLYCENETH